MFSKECMLLPLHAPTATKLTCALWVVLGLARASCFPVPPQPCLSRSTLRVHPMCLWVDARSCHALSVCT